MESVRQQLLAKSIASMSEVADVNHSINNDSNFQVGTYNRNIFEVDAEIRQINDSILEFKESLNGSIGS